MMGALKSSARSDRSYSLESGRRRPSQNYAIICALLTNRISSVADYEEAARIHNQCRSRGIAGSAIDFLICAAAIRRDWQIFTTDQDFTHYAKACPLQLYNLT